jgi:hypothetical protein
MGVGSEPEGGGVLPRVGARIGCGAIATPLGAEAANTLSSPQNGGDASTPG